MMKKMKEENVEVKKKDVCGNCKKDLKRSDHLRRHVKSVHEWDEEGEEMTREMGVALVTPRNGVSNLVRGRRKRRCQNLQNMWKGGSEMRLH